SLRVGHQNRAGRPAREHEPQDHAQTDEEQDADDPGTRGAPPVAVGIPRKVSGAPVPEHASSRCCVRPLPERPVCALIEPRSCRIKPLIATKALGPRPHSLSRRIAILPAALASFGTPSVTPFVTSSVALIPLRHQSLLPRSASPLL